MTYKEVNKSPIYTITPFFGVYMPGVASILASPESSTSVSSNEIWMVEFIIASSINVRRSYVVPFGDRDFPHPSLFLTQQHPPP